MGQEGQLCLGSPLWGELGLEVGGPGQGPCRPWRRTCEAAGPWGAALGSEGSGVTMTLAAHLWVW